MDLRSTLSAVADYVPGDVENVLAAASAYLPDDLEKAIGFHLLQLFLKCNRN